MGDPRRFDLMARLVAAEFPEFQGAHVADVAGGKGYLKAALREYGFRSVTTIDKRHKNAKGRPGQRYGHFTKDSRPEFSLLVGMHPDEATDHIALHARDYGVPFVLCPCCIKPDGTAYWGRHKFEQWVNHLKQLTGHPTDVREVVLPMDGRNLVLIWRPRI